MKPFRSLSAVEQLATHLRGEILRGGLSGHMPGALALVSELGVSPNTVLGALRQLESEGLLVGQGPGRRSKIVVPDDLRPPGLRIEILLFEMENVAINYVVELKHQLQEAGHLVTFSGKSLCGMKMEVGRVARYVRGRQAEAWVVICGSLPVLEWFAAQPAPALAMFGRGRDVDMASVMPEKIPALRAAVERLLELGHRRVVLLVREHNRGPQRSLVTQTFLDALEAHGIRTSAYNLPDWSENAAGVCRCLDELYQHTPPTAILIDEAAPFMVARMHLAQRRIVAPRDVSLICMDSDPIFAWSEPAISHVRWNTDTMIRRIAQWADNVARGRTDRHKTRLKATFLEGGTIGPVGG